MKTTSLICAFCLGAALAASAQSTIVYFDGPAFPLPGCYDSIPLDINQDGVADFNFSSGASLTTGFPNSGYTPFYVSSLNTNGILCRGGEVVVLPAGTIIGGLAFSNATWTISDGATLASYFFSGGGETLLTTSGSVSEPPSSGWGGPLSAAGPGYLGVRFQAADGLHYGWVHAWLPTNAVGGGLSPTILDWAYETRPNTAIAAAAAPIAPLLTPQIVRPGQLRLNWPSPTGHAYQVQFKDHLDTPFWSNLDFTSIATAPTTAIDVPITAPTRFYRVVQVQ